MANKEKAYNYEEMLLKAEKELKPQELKAEPKEKVNWKTKREHRRKPLLNWNRKPTRFCGHLVVKA